MCFDVNLTINNIIKENLLEDTGGQLIRYRGHFKTFGMRRMNYLTEKGSLMVQSK